MSAAVLMGWGHADITPEEPVLLGGQFRARLSEGVNSPVTATALVVDATAQDAGNVSVIISCDLVTIPDSLRGEIRAAVLKAVPELAAERILISATHTHDGPEVRQESDFNSTGGGNVPPDSGVEFDAMETADYIAFVAARVAAAVQQAWESRAESGIGFGLGHAVVGRNRLMRYLDGSGQMYGNTNDVNFANIEGDCDHGVNVLAVWDKQQKLTGVLVNLACPAQEEENDFTISSDFWHETRLELRKRLGDDIFLLPQCSAAGDQSPHILVGKAYEERMNRLLGRTNRQEIAVRIVDAVESVLPAIAKEIDWAPQLAHVCNNVELPRRLLTQDDLTTAAAEVEAAKAEYAAILADLEANPEKRNEPRWYTGITAAYRKIRWKERVAVRYELEKTIPTLAVELHCLRLGDVAMASNPYELYLDYGQRMKACSPAVQTFIVQLAGAGTYLPSARAIAGNGYGAAAATTQAGPKAGQVIVETTLQTLNKFWPAGR